MVMTFKVKFNLVSLFMSASQPFRPLVSWLVGWLFVCLVS